MNNRHKTRLAIVYIIFGLILFGCGLLELVDEFWSGMGSAFAFVGILQLVRCIKYNTNENYRENVDTNAKDERNRFLSMKSWSWAAYLYVISAAVATIVLRILGHEDMSFAASMSICVILMLYWISYMVLKRKY